MQNACFDVIYEFLYTKESKNGFFVSNVCLIFYLKIIKSFLLVFALTMLTVAGNFFSLI